MKINKWLLLGYIATIFNPVPSGIVAGLVFFTEKKYKNHGAIMLIVSIFLAILEIVLATYFSGVLI